MSWSTRRILLQPRVTEDLERQVEYLDERANPEVSDRYLKSVYGAFDLLAQMPGMGAPREQLNPRLNGLRMWPVPDFPKYLIFYRATDETVEVIRVLHGAQDIEGIISEEL
jgi:toxin ParE1/3/4